MPRLRVELLSPLACGSGIAQPGVVDRDVVRDPSTGLVFIPGRRLKGLLLDAWREILGWGAFDPSVFPSPETVFGATGQGTPGALRLGNAHLVSDNGTPFDGVRLGAELRGHLKGSAGAWGSQDVVRYLTEVRRQTSVDRHTGAARRDTLRFTRVLREGLVFEAAFDAVPQPVLAAVALAAAGVKIMGSSRNRGWGRVRLSVIGAEGQPVDVRAAVSAPHAALETSSSATRLPAVDVPRVNSAPTHSLGFTLTLQEPALFNDPGAGDPNTNMTLEYVPGSTIQGVLASAFLSTDAPDAKRFHELFCSGAVSFLPAAPSIEGHAARRVPHSVRRNKDHTEPVDLAVTDPVSDHDKARLQGWFDPESWTIGVPSEEVQLNRSVHYHHQRAHDSRLQRALGSENEDLAAYGLTSGQSGALFVYESLDPGQTFIGEILGGEADLRELLSILPSGAEARIGRSRSAQYGGLARWNWQEIEPFQPKAEAHSPERVIVRLLTPLIARNAHGHPCAEFPLKEFDPEARIEKAFTRRGFTSGYFSHQNLPKEQMPTLEAGSTFVLTGVRTDLTAAASRSYGMRTEEGYGRIEISSPPDELPERLFDEAKQGRAKRIDDPALKQLARSILRQRIEEHTLVQARLLAGDTRRIDRVRPHLLHRLIQVLEGDKPLEKALEFLTKARRTAREQLEAVRVKGKPLPGFLKETIDNRDAAFTELTNIAGREAWVTLLGYQPKSAFDKDALFVETVVATFLRRYLSALVRERKRNAD